MNKNTACVTGCYILWGILPVFWKLMDMLPPFYILANRILWSFVFYSLILLVLGKWKEIRAVFSDWKQAGLMAVCGAVITVNWGSYIWAVNSGNIVESSLAYYLSPILSVGAAALVLKEKVSRREWFAMGIAALGVAVPVIRYGRFPGLTLLIGGSFVAYGVLKKKITCGYLTSLFVESLVMVPFSIFYIIYSGRTGIGGAAMGGAQYLLLPLSGAITAVPLLLFSKGAAKIPYSLTGILMYINPTLQLIIGVALYGEKISAENFIMLIFVWIALAVFLTGKQKAVKTAR